MITESFKEAFVDVDGVRIRYRDGGSGPAIMYLHGAGGLQHSPAYESLAQTFRVIAFELPGSACVEDLAGTMNAAVAALGIERYSLIGTSFAAKIALWMAILRPETVEAIVLSAPAAFRISEGPVPARESDAAFEQRAAELQQPVLVLFGTVDEGTPVDAGLLYREILQDCHIVLVYDAAHAIDADRPEAFASLVGDFLSRKDQFIVTKTSALIHP